MFLVGIVGTATLPGIAGDVVVKTLLVVGLWLEGWGAV
jgi:hypothetical protein